jgi:hypothetical protein
MNFVIYILNETRNLMGSAKWQREEFGDVTKWYYSSSFNIRAIFGPKFDTQKHTSNLQGKCLPKCHRGNFWGK